MTSVHAIAVERTIEYNRGDLRAVALCPQLGFSGSKSRINLPFPCALSGACPQPQAQTSMFAATQLRFRQPLPPWFGSLSILSAALTVHLRPAGGLTQARRDGHECSAATNASSTFCDLKDSALPDA